MFAQVESPESLTPAQLDAYLERGWFRMRQNIFTTNFVHFKNQFYSALWLRVVLDKFSEDSSLVKIIKRNAGFKTVIQPANITVEKENLYIRYKEQLPFEPMASLTQLLFLETTSRNIYNTYEVAVFDDDKLIAVGFFDLGHKSAAGIVSVYDPDYRKYSLGKYIIYQKIAYCRERQMQYFYPGYFVPGYPAFDYKLSIGKPALEFLQVSSDQWLSISKFSSENDPYQVMLQRLTALQQLLVSSGLQGKVVKYEFFDAGLFPELKDAGLFDFPLMMHFPEQSDDTLNPIIIFDVRDAQYHLLQCVPVYAPQSPLYDPAFYSEYIIRQELDIFATTSMIELAALLLQFFMANK
ncbi:MAG TPA: GNAT family N-acetyltransferase [Ohtaekwangia sp.]|uniref:GNAT family N-acetyltransferase n=1 Tax=Ohtaekwangia sp. TaxID=2066019 RepID=UPI002F934887